MAARIQLPYTLQVFMGIVIEHGLPSPRCASIERKTSTAKFEETLGSFEAVTIPYVGRTPPESPDYPDHFSVTCFRDFCDTDWFSAVRVRITDIAFECIRQGRSPDIKKVFGGEAAVARFTGNINACRDQSVDASQLIGWMKSRTRLDLEQTAAAVVSALVNAGRVDEASHLLREIAGVFSVANMHIGDRGLLKQRTTFSNTSASAFAHFAKLLHTWSKKADPGRENVGDVPPQDYVELVQLLLRVRCARPQDHSRCLYIPAWLFEAAGIQPPEHHAAFLNGYQANPTERRDPLDDIKVGVWPESTVPQGEESVVVLSKHGFRIVQRRIFYMFPFWDSAVKLRREIRALEDDILLEGEWLDRQLNDATDVTEIAEHFFALQRRLQPRIVSNDATTRFLVENQDRRVPLYHNETRMKSTFELALAQISRKEPRETSLTTALNQRAESILASIDKTCLLMKKYVEVHGHGTKQNLVFDLDIAEDDDTRGPVDEYNVLCDILQELSYRAKDKGWEKVPGPSRKFLERSFLENNNAWDEDAFAGGKKAGWEDWIVTRGL